MANTGNKNGKLMRPLTRISPFRNRVTDVQQADPSQTATKATTMRLMG